MKESVVEIGGHRYRYGYDPDTSKTVYLGPVGDGPRLNEQAFGDFMRRLGQKIQFYDISELDRQGDKHYIRKMEMTLETASKNNVPLVLQFFKDLRLYDLDEAILYVQQYELNGEYKAGTTTKLLLIADDIKKDLGEPGLSAADRYNLEEDIRVEEAMAEQYPGIAKLSERMKQMALKKRAMELREIGAAEGFIDPETGKARKPHRESL